MTRVNLRNQEVMAAARETGPPGARGLIAAGGKCGDEKGEIGRLRVDGFAIIWRLGGVTVGQ
jgi:hypothetical protein